MNPYQTKSKKEDLTVVEKMKAEQMFKMGAGIGQIARLLSRNKPTIKKALGVWNADDQVNPDGIRYFIRRGIVITYPKKEVTI